MPETDIWGTTRKLIELYGPDAWATAAARVERRIKNGDRDGARRWLEIAKAVRHLDDRRAGYERQGGLSLVAGDSIPNPSATPSMISRSPSEGSGCNSIAARA